MTIMYLIQRKSDGKFFKNKTYSGYNHDSFSDEKDAHWSVNADDCKPFKTIGGAKSSRGWVGHKRVLIVLDGDKDAAQKCEICFENNKPTNGHWHHWKRVKRTEEELPYRVVSVAVT